MNYINSYIAAQKLNEQNKMFHECAQIVENLSNDIDETLEREKKQYYLV